MANQVYANNMEVSCKKAAGKSICAFPDVCFTPPQTPATPPGVPIPYPNTGMASDTTSGSSTVKISGQEVMLKNKSHFKKSTGDEAGCAPKKGVVTSKNTGKVYFNAWSMDVKVEGENVVRNLDLTTHNHGSVPGNSPIWPYLDESALKLPSACQEDATRAVIACKDCGDKEERCAALEPLPYEKVTATGKPKQLLASPESRDLSKHIAANECENARRCFLQQYDRDKTQCCPPQTPHHLIEASSLFVKGRGGSDSIPLAGVNTTGADKAYDENKAPCVCAEGTSQSMDGTHGWMHTMQSVENAKCPSGVISPGNGGPPIEFPHVTTYKDAKKNAIAAMQKVFPGSKCDPDCLEAQLDSYHSQCGITDDTQIKAVVEGNVKPGEGIARAQSGIEECAAVAPPPMQFQGVGLEGAAQGLPSFPFFS
jgi:Domain of unknown function (DUF4150)/GHH signature containing HNH/Endo VII superfamily nuclease toxin  2